jgi:iron complex outermembrane receptor protein
MPRAFPRLGLLAGCAAVAAAPALAGETPQDALHSLVGPDIVVTGAYARERLEVKTGVSVLEGEALVREVRPTIGETLARQPGVSATSFGPGASRPILRGQQGERIRVLTDGIGTFDVANTSVDHAVMLNPLLADRVEIVRGPGTLLFGSSAIGGVVNVQDRRIPRAVPDEAVHLDAFALLASAAEERGGSAALDVPLGRSGLVFHADGSWLKTGDLRTGGFVFAPELRAAAAGIGGEVEDQSLIRGRIPNSDTESSEVGAGLAWIGAGGSFGLSVSHFRTDYGIPNTLFLDDDDDEDDDDAITGTGLGEIRGMGGGEEPEQDIRIRMRQTRVDARAMVPLGGAFDRLNLRFGFADYRHDEIDDEGDIETSFFNKALEVRADLVQRERGGWRGASGVQAFIRDFDTVGAEAYIPRNATEQVGFFTVQEFDLGAGLRAEVGGRYEHTSVRSGPVNVRRRFDAFSGAAGLSLAVASDWRLALNLSHAERAPAAEELVSDGPHLATRAFEVGDPDLRKERSTGIEGVLRGRGEGVALEAAVFWTRFSNFIYLDPTGEVEDGLPVFAYRQGGATFWGFEIDGRVDVARVGRSRLALTGLVDLVRADLRGGLGPVPRIPPLRLLGGAELAGGPLGGRIEVEHVTRQDRTAAFETGTPGWTMVNASLAWRPFGADSLTVVTVSANNIFDVEARRHASFLKAEAPLAGRDVRLAARFSF